MTRELKNKTATEKDGSFSGKVFETIRKQAKEKGIDYTQSVQH